MIFEVELRKRYKIAVVATDKDTALRIAEMKVTGGANVGDKVLVISTEIEQGYVKELKP